MMVSDLLLRSRLFTNTDPQIIRSVAEKLIPKNFKKGETLFGAGGKPDYLYFIEKGKISFIIPDVDGRDHFIDFASDGHFFGENELIGNNDYFANAVAMESSQLWLLPRADFEWLFREVPQISQNIAKLLVANIRLFHQARFEAQKRSLDFRLANLLLVLLTRFGEKTARGERITMHLPHEELAFMVSATRQSVTKVMRNWQERGWLESTYGKIILLDKDAIKAYRDGCE